MLEEDDATRGEQYQVAGKAAGPGRSFTLYLYDREKHHVREGDARRVCWCVGVWVCGCVVERERCVLVRDVTDVCGCVCGCGCVACVVCGLCMVGLWWGCGGLGQTVVRRLQQSETHDARLNPFIEKSSTGAVTGHSLASTTAFSVSPKPVVGTDDVVVDGPPPASEAPLRVEFAVALQRALGLADSDLAVLRSTDPSSATPFVANTLCAVSVCVL